MARLESESGFLYAVHSHRESGNRLHDDREKAHEIFQTSLVSALLEGVYDGDMSLKELRKHGDFGLGTFNALDGEMLLLDGTFYQLRSDGKAYVAGDMMKTPFAVVIFFCREMEQRIASRASQAELKAKLEEIAPSHNFFYAIKLSGLFSNVKVRSVPRQKKPYPLMTEVVTAQRVFELKNVSGTMVGFRFPDYSQGLNVAGYHFHFIDDDRTAGGHVLDCILEEGTLWIDHTSSFHVELPETRAFAHSDLNKPDMDNVIKSVER